LFFLPHSGQRQRKSRRWLRSEKNLGKLAHHFPLGGFLLADKIASYPVFDEEKAIKEAGKRFPLIKVGEEVSVLYRRREAKGKFYGIERNILKIGGKKVPLMDINQSLVSRFSPEENKKVRDQFIKQQKLDYYAKRRDFVRDSRENLYLKYPTLSLKALKIIFSKIDDQTKKKSYCDEFTELYHQKLPVKTTQREMMSELAKIFLAKHQELAREGNCFWPKAQLEAIEKRRKELKTNRLARLTERFMFPKTATPTFEPDGGKFSPDTPITLACATPGSVIYYTVNGDEPTMDSLIYNDPIVLDKAVKIRARAFHPEYNDSETTINGVWAGGVYGSYFAKMIFKGDTVTRLDSEIDFNWSSGTPDTRIPNNYFSVIWTGRIIPKFSERYTFYLTGDDGFRFWVERKLVVDGWEEQPATEYDGSIDLVAGKKYDIKAILTEVGGPA